MAAGGNTLVVLDGRVTDEKLDELLGLQTETQHLDFKEVIDPTSTSSLVELAKDVGAFQVAGGYIIGGVDGQGVPNGSMDHCDPRQFDSANLVRKLKRYLPDPLTIHSRVTQSRGHTVVILYVERNPDGCAVFKAIGQYPVANRKTPEVVFRPGEIFWRDGTSSERISQEGFRAVVAGQVAAAKSAWMEEQDELRRRDREVMEAGVAARELARAPLGTLNFAAAPEELQLGVLELLRADDRIGLLHLLNQAPTRAASSIERDEIETELADLLDKLAAIGAVALEYEEDELLDRVIGVLRVIYSLPLGEHDDRRLSISSHIAPEEKAPRVFLEVLKRVYGLGALAVRRERWEIVRRLTLQAPERVDDYWPNWLRHGLTIATRAEQLAHKREDGQEVKVSLLSLAAQVVERVPALRPDTDDQERILTSLVEFDFLANVAAIDEAGNTDSAVFYTNWARFRQHRVQQVADRLLSDRRLREAVFRNHGDDDLAAVLREMSRRALSETWHYAGFDGWEGTAVAEFLRAHPPG